MNGQSRSVDDALKNSVVKLQEVILLYFSALSLDLLRFSCLPAGPQHPERCPLPLNCNTNELLWGNVLLHMQELPRPLGA